jgi:hypothetical protein
MFDLLGVNEDYLKKCKDSDNAKIIFENWLDSLGKASIDFLYTIRGDAGGDFVDAAIEAYFTNIFVLYFRRLQKYIVNTNYRIRIRKLRKRNKKKERLKRQVTQK